MIILGLGSNLPSSFGDRFHNIDLAVKYLENSNITILKKSSYYETFSYPNIDDPKFINIVILIETKLTPENLAKLILKIEEKLERIRKNKNAPRTCDIDIIDFDNKIFNFKYKNLDFMVPHEKLESRNFVLFPLKEVSPNWKHPKNNSTIDELINNLPTNVKNSILIVKKS